MEGMERKAQREIVAKRIPRKRSGSRRVGADRQCEGRKRTLEVIGKGKKG